MCLSLYHVVYLFYFLILISIEKELKEKESQSVVTTFIFLGLSNHLELQGLVFLMVLIIYLIALLGNAFTLTVVRVSPSLHTSMYYFLNTLTSLGHLLLLHHHSHHGGELLLEENHFL